MRVSFVSPRVVAVLLGLLWSIGANAQDGASMEITEQQCVFPRGPSFDAVLWCLNQANYAYSYAYAVPAQGGNPEGEFQITLKAKEPLNELISRIKVSYPELDVSVRALSDGGWLLYNTPDLSSTPVTFSGTYPSSQLALDALLAQYTSPSGKHPLTDGAEANFLRGQKETTLSGNTLAEALTNWRTAFSTARHAQWSLRCGEAFCTMGLKLTTSDGPRLKPEVRQLGKTPDWALKLRE